MKRGVLGAGLICIAATLWGLDGVVLTPRLANLQVPLVVFLIHAIPFIFMQPFLLKSYGQLYRLDWKGWLALLLVALFGGLIGTVAIVKALFLVNFNHLSIVVLLQKLQPIFALVLAALILKERPQPRFYSWAALALVGAYILTFGFGLPVISGDNLVGAALYALLAAAAFGSATVFGKFLLGKLDFKAATFGRFGLTSFLALLYLLALGFRIPLGEVTPMNWLIIAIIAATSGSGAIFLYYYGLTSVRASVSTICELCLPLSALFFDWLVNGSLLSVAQGIGAIILLGSILRIAFLKAQ